MKNPFKQNDHKVLITGIIIGSVAAGAAAYLFLTDTGSAVREQLAGHFNRLKDRLTGNEPEPVADHHTDYMHHKQKAPKTDRERLLKHEILSNEPAGPADENNHQE